MPNYYHLLLETPEPNLVAGMKWFQGTYTQRFNVRNRLSGHLFQGRYKALPIEADDPDYFRLVSDYIHLNPVRAMLLRGDRPRLAGYRWSSYPDLIGGKALNPGLIRARYCIRIPSRGMQNTGRNPSRGAEAQTERPVEAGCGMVGEAPYGCS